MVTQLPDEQATSGWAPFSPREPPTSPGAPTEFALQSMDQLQCIRLGGSVRAHLRAGNGIVIPRLRVLSPLDARRLGQDLERYRPGLQLDRACRLGAIAAAVDEAVRYWLFALRRRSQ